MSEALYNLVIVKHTSDQSVDALVQKLLTLLGRVDDPQLEYKLSESLLFEGSASAIVEDTGLEQAKKYQQLFLQLGVESKLTPSLQLVAKATEENTGAGIHTCPSCQHRQPIQGESPDVCTRCGVSAEKFHTKAKLILKRRELYLEEKKKLEKAQEESLKTAQAQATHEETEQLREEARNKLGIKKKKQAAITIAGVTAVTLTGIAGYFIYDDYNKSTQQEAALVAEAINRDGSAITVAGIPEGAQNAPTGKGISTATALQAVQNLTGNRNHAAVGIQGRDAPLSQTEAQQSLLAGELTQATAEQIAAITVKLSPQQLESLSGILKRTGDKAFGHTDSGEYTKLIPKLNRLLALDKPGLGLVFAEGGSDPYAAALLILEVASSEQQKKRGLYYDDIILTMKNMAVKADSGDIAPLLTSALSQAYTMTGDPAAADVLLEKAIQEAEDTADTPEQSIQWLTRMLIDHQHFNHLYGSERLLSKLESLAVNTPVNSSAGQLTLGSIYSHLAAISVNNGDIADAEGWLKKIPVKSTRDYLQTYLDNI